jgi:signal transduction histidine kinase/ActR/RegA family two-component response regulator
MTPMDHDTVLLARIIEHTPIGIAILTPDRKIVFVNELAVHLLNRDRGALLGTSIDHYLVDRYGETRLQDLWPSVMIGKTREVTVGLARHGGEEIPCALTAFYIGGKDGLRDSAAVIFRDITHELAIADQLEKKTIEMAKMNTELIHSNIELKRLSAKKLNFLSIASHELKTPLTSIMGYSDLIVDDMKDRIDSGVYHMIESINRAANRLNNVINNILDVTRIEQKRLRLKPETLNLCRIAKDSIEDLVPVAAKRAISFNCTLGDKLPDFYGDRLRLQQVFANLLSNAIKFSPDRSAVDVSVTVEDGVRFHIFVKDHGIGIDVGEQKHIFDPFSEVGDVSKHSTDPVKFKGGGIGLGLSIAKGIVERHGGRIWVESPGVGMRPGEYPGSVFHILLPIRSEIEWDDLEKEQPPSAVTPGPIAQQTSAKAVLDSGKPSLLLIDTDSEAVEVTRMVLENTFDVLTAPTGEQGLLLAFQYQPPVILLDSSLPGLGGLRVCKILRSQEETRNAAIVFLSSKTESEKIEECFAAGANDFIVKPFRGTELIDKLWHLMMKRKTDSYPVVS